jgi:hypothetical protein
MPGDEQHDKRKNRGPAALTLNSVGLELIHGKDIRVHESCAEEKQPITVRPESCSPCAYSAKSPEKSRPDAAQNCRIVQGLCSGLEDV